MADLTSSGPSWMRLLAAFGLLPPIQAVVAYFGFPLWWTLGAQGNGRPADPSQSAGAFAILVGVMGTAVTVLGAVPAVLWLLRRGETSLLSFLRAGLILGNAPFALYVVGLVVPLTIAHVLAGTMEGRWLSASELIAGTVRALLLGSFFGVLSAAVFWSLALRAHESPNVTLKSPSGHP